MWRHLKQEKQGRGLNPEALFLFSEQKLSQIAAQKSLIRLFVFRRKTLALFWIFL